MKHLLLSLALFSAMGSFAQTDLVELVRSDMRATKQALVTANMTLTEEQSKLFWPLYDGYSAELKKVWDARIAIYTEYGKRLNDMDEATAKSLMARMLANDKQKLALRATWSKKMMKNLPATVVARFFQIDNQIDLLVCAQIADEVPLMPAK